MKGGGGGIQFLPCHFPVYACNENYSFCGTALLASLFHNQISGKIHRGGVIEESNGGSVGAGVMELSNKVGVWGWWGGARSLRTDREEMVS